MTSGPVDETSAEVTVAQYLSGKKQLQIEKDSVIAGQKCFAFTRLGSSMVFQTKDYAAISNVLTCLDQDVNVKEKGLDKEETRKPGRHKWFLLTIPENATADPSGSIWTACIYYLPSPESAICINLCPES